MYFGVELKKKEGGYPLCGKSCSEGGETRKNVPSKFPWACEKSAVLIDEKQGRIVFGMKPGCQ